jgi:hypothetical protein
MIRAAARGGIGYTQNGVLDPVPRELGWGLSTALLQISFRYVFNPAISSVDAMKLNTR